MSAFATTAFDVGALAETAFDFGTGPIPVVTPSSVGSGAWIPFAKRPKQHYERVRDEDFDSDVTPEPIEPAASLELPEIVVPRPSVGCGPAMPEAPTFEPPAPWTPTTEADDAVRQRHLARVAAVEAARERIRVAHEQRMRAAEDAARAEHARQARAQHEASMISLLLQLDDL